MLLPSSLTRTIEGSALKPGRIGLRTNGIVASGTERRWGLRRGGAWLLRCTQRPSTGLGVVDERRLLFSRLFCRLPTPPLSRAAGSRMLAI
jgi:hypothetical protein